MTLVDNHICAMALAIVQLIRRPVKVSEVYILSGDAASALEKALMASDIYQGRRP